MSTVFVVVLGAIIGTLIGWFTLATAYLLVMVWLASRAARKSRRERDAATNNQTIS